MKKILSAALIALMAAASADAAPLTFTLKGDYSATWQVDAAPKPSDAADGFVFVLYDLPFANTASGMADVYFYNASQLGGLEIYDYSRSKDILFTAGPQLYTGLETAPVFRTGTFALADINGPGRYSLTIAPTAAGAVPEPATWAMFIGGFGLIGGSMRRRQRANVRFA
nr:PEPxxWA-CTERM sorting domain-containing protein [uncultured Sphingomonas sp.]